MPGTFVLSLDTELAWGSFDRSLSPRLLRAAAWENREGIPRLLKLLCQHRISATWAFVGHAMLNHCSGHSDLDPVRYAWYTDDWFKHDPKSDEARHPEWYGRHSFLKVLRASFPQEIGFHSFSHVIFGDPGTSRRRAVQEMYACRELAREFQVDGNVFIFPRNCVGYLDELRDAGFRVFRAPDVSPFRSRSDVLGKGLGVLLDVFAITPMSVSPYVDHDLIALPGSLMLRSCDHWRSLIPSRMRRARIMKGIDRCIRDGEIFHLWFHPINLYSRQREMFDLLEACFSRICILRDRGDLQIMTMGECALSFQAQAIPAMVAG
jgi:hypothetical protein